MRNSRWVRLLAYVTGSVNQELLLRNEPQLSWAPASFTGGGDARIRMARENSGWGYDRIAGALANLGDHLSDQTVGNILRLCSAKNQSRITQPPFSGCIHDASRRE